MEEKINQLKTILAEVSDLNGASSVLGWDQQTYMPRHGAQTRGHQLATLDRLAHLKFTAPEVGELIEALTPAADQFGPDSDEACLVRVTRRIYQKQVKVPAALVSKMSEARTAAHESWVEARSTNDFARFQPDLERTIDLMREYAECFAPFTQIYDPLLDDYEPGMRTEDVKAIFNILRPEQVSLIRQISERPQVDDSFLHQLFPEQKQWDFSVMVATQIGWDWERGRLDQSPHPFTSNASMDDVRLTTRINPGFFNTALFATLHEAGHGLYELGVDPALGRTPLAGGASLAVHESQSRMWENLVGRSLPFWEFFYPRLQEAFPSQFANVGLDQFYKGINRVQPTLIRVEADEATYNLHIMLRFELEIDLMEGRLAVKDLPEAWNSRMQEYLGVTPSNDADGVLQDIHWSMGLIGYFSTYALGNLVSAQLWEKVNLDNPNLEDQFRQGNFSELLDWLVQNIHRHGAKFEPQEFIQRVTGSKIDSSPYIHFLRRKYVNIYGLDT
jgi:carboxypeptidase Taq